MESNENRGPANLNELEESASIDENESFVEDARSYFANDFSNPERIGCPPQSEIELVVSASVLPASELRAHIFGCSECFRFYRACLETRDNRAVIGDARQARWFSGRRALFGIAAAVGVIAFSCGVYFLVRTSNSPAPARDRALTRQPREGNAEQSVARTRSPAIDPQPNGSEGLAREPARLTEISIDLSRSGHVRGTETGNRIDELPTALLSRGKNRVSIKLPNGSRRGNYKITLVDAFAKVLLTARSGTPDGRTLTVVLDLTSISENPYRLCVVQGDNVPDCYPVTLGR